MKKLITHKYFFWFITAILSGYVFIVFIKSPGINGYERAMFPEMIYGTSWKPFVYRTLLPSAVRVTSEIIPEQIHNSLTEKIEDSEFGKLVLQKLKWESEFITEYLIAMIYMWWFLVGVVYAFRKLLTAVYYSPKWFANFISLTALFALPTMFQYYSYIYDFPTMFLFTSGLVLLVKQKWNYFLILFFISCFNKETTILLTLVFAIHLYNNGKVSKRLYYKLIAAQIFIFISIKTLLYFLFIDNPGGFVEFHLIDRNYLIFNGFTLTTFVVWLTIGLMTFSKWGEKPKFLKDAIWIGVPLIVLSFFLGFFDELRDYYELFPIVFLLVTFNIGRFLGLNLMQNRN
ncbi:MAG: hypothetical protein KJN64_13920 [Ignavibacteria bacterium]|nr:hypothetical protein [Ignavibacteria bacterium]MBT8382490.1 hypothetical protein [Ignavibacteria bacterium]NNL21927.1 hypothetical protein [Ignavibacteriaceae bacterium]